jgi:gamma-glutamylcyclotransferase
MNNDHRCFIINESGYANIIHSPGDHVYGLVFALSAKDVKLMDEHEGDDYTRKTMWLQVTTSSDYEEDETTGDEKALVYKDVDRTEHGVPGEDQNYRMNMAVMDALDAGVPQSYIDKYIRVFIPE